MQVYLVTNKVNGKKYVGQTVQTLKKRWSSHGSDMKRRRGPHALVHALLKYGKENFSIRTLKICRTREELNTLEKHLIVKFKTKAPNGYNITDGGDGTPGLPWTPKQRARWIKANRGKRKGVNNAFFGKHHTSDSIAKMSASAKGRKASPETRKAMSIAAGGWKHGTFTGYGKYRCRCEVCRKWRHDYHIEKFGIKTKEEISRKLSESHKGLPSWNKGTTKGTYWDKEFCKWAVILWVNGKTKRFGRFSTKAEAEATVLKLRIN
jgi:group I intron endonuclease